MITRREFYEKFSSEKIKINGSNNLIKMKTFLSFLSVELIRSNDHLGNDTGWTLLENKELNLRIHGGFINRVEYLNDIRFGKNLSNPYNNYVNPFYLWDILSKEGIDFFISYYADDVSEAIKKAKEKMKQAKSESKLLSDYYNSIKKFE